MVVTSCISATEHSPGSAWQRNHGAWYGQLCMILWSSLTPVVDVSHQQVTAERIAALLSGGSVSDRVPVLLPLLLV